MRNFRSPRSSSSRTFCLSSCRFPTMSCPSTSTTTISPCFLIEKLMCQSPESTRSVEGRRCRCLKRGDGRHVENVLCTRSAREIVAWTAHPLEDGSDRARGRKSLHQLVGDVARVQGRQDQDRRLARHLAAGRLAGRHGMDERSVTLQFSVHGKL